MDADIRIDALEDRVAFLEGRIALLEEALFDGYVSPVEWGLTGSETRVMGVLVKRDLATKTAIMAALYADANRDAAEIKIVDVFVCKLRRKVQRFGVEIETCWGQGYRLKDRAKYGSGA